MTVRKLNPEDQELLDRVNAKLTGGKITGHVREGDNRSDDVICLEHGAARHTRVLMYPVSSMSEEDLSGMWHAWVNDKAVRGERYTTDTFFSMENDAEREAL